MLLCQLLIPKAWKPELGTSQALLDRSRTDGEQNFVVLQVLQLLSCDHEQSVPRDNVVSIKLVLCPSYIFLTQWKI